MNISENTLKQLGYGLLPDGSWSKAPASPAGLSHYTERQRGPQNEPLAAAPRANPDQKRRLVRLTAIRRRLLDERNLFDKHFVDSLVDAGILVDDSPAWAQVEITQKIGSFEYTLIEVYDL